MNPLYLRIKNAVDFIGSIALLIVLWPLLLVIAILIKLESRGPVFFIQERIGRLGRPFQLYKFRTMVCDAMERGGYETSERDPRITKIGKFLRAWSLDELPQLWNIAKGEMSFIGPRPTLAYQVEKYSERERKRLLVKPGLTGLAQINGRNRLTWPERIEYDLQYIENFSLWQDIRILIKTVLLVIRQEGVYGN